MNRGEKCTKIRILDSGMVQTFIFTTLCLITATIASMTIFSTAFMMDNQKSSKIIELKEEEIIRLKNDIAEINKENTELERYITELEETIETQKKTEQIHMQSRTIGTFEKYYASPTPMVNEEVHVVTLREVPEKIDVSKSTTISGLSSDEFNELIDTIVEHRKISDCVFTGTGESFAKVEEEYGINGIYLLAIFTNESSFGENTVRKNNAAGIKIGGEYTSFDSINDCILYLGKLLKTYNDKYDRDTFSEIGDRYCPGNQDWIDDNADVCNLYADFAYKNIYEPT